LAATNRDELDAESGLAISAFLEQNWRPCDRDLDGCQLHVLHQLAEII
jgi:hypothetical protein